MVLLKIWTFPQKLSARHANRTQNSVYAPPANLNNQNIYKQEQKTIPFSNKIKFDFYKTKTTTTITNINLSHSRSSRHNEQKKNLLISRLKSKSILAQNFKQIRKFIKKQQKKIVKRKKFQQNGGKFRIPELHLPSIRLRCRPRDRMCNWRNLDHAQ